MFTTNVFTHMQDLSNLEVNTKNKKRDKRYV